MKLSTISLIAICLSLFAFYLPKETLIESPTIKNIELEVTEGTNMATALSPDKQTLAIDLQGRLWLLSVNGGKATAITDELGDARQPAWSPDGEKLTFQSYWDGNWHIYIIDKKGEQLEQLTHGLYDHREPHWSPDGKQIAFASDRGGTYDIWTYDLEKKALTQITEFAGNEYAPAWNDRGNRLAYIADAPDRKGIFYYSFLKKKHSNVYKGEEQLSGLSWRPDGSSILFVAHDFDESNLKQQWLDMPEAMDLTKNGAEDVFPFRVSWLSNQEYIYTADGKIKRANIEFKNQKEIPFSATFQLKRPTYPSKKRFFDESEPKKVKGITHPTLAPNATDFAFIALNNIWIQKGNGSLTQVTQDAFTQLAPAWSPDGQQLAFTSDKEGSWAIYIFNQKDNSIRKLGNIATASSGLAWSPDGQYIAYSLSFGPRLGQLWKMEIATGKTTQISKAIPSSVACPTWSADGKTIAITSLKPYSTLYREGLNRLLFFAADGSKSWNWKGLKDWSLGIRGQDGPVWSPDGKYLAAISQGVLWMVPVDQQGQATASPIRLTNELSDIPSWSGDAKHILYLSTEGLKKINIENGVVEKMAVNLETARKSPKGRTVIHVKGLFDGIKNQLRENVDIIIEDNRIIAIEAHQDNRQADKKIDASDSYAMPGLIDIHSHQGSWGGEKLGRTWLSWGVIATRDPATDPYDALNRREATEAGDYRGPRIFFTGSPIDGNRIYYGGSYAFQSPAQLALELERAAALDYDLIKTYVRLADPLQKQVIQKAHELGLPVTSHELYPATAYGIDGIEHIAGTSRRGYSPKLTATLASYGDVSTLIAKSGMSFTPTIGIYVSYNYLLAQNPSVLEDERLKKLESPFNLQNAKSGINQVKKDEKGWEKRFRNACKMIKDVQLKGGLISAGTDGPILPYGFGLHMELEAYQAAGLSPYEVLQTATINNAKVLGTAADMGSIEAGKLADIIIIKKNPLEDVKNMRALEWTIVNGRAYTLEDLLK
jgi:Tol biopolymer transport system component/imidazolonepropionase-like amidohydrolase